jgi:hypothetical protein
MLSRVTKDYIVYLESGNKSHVNFVKSIKYYKDINLICFIHAEHCIPKQTYFISTNVVKIESNG